MGTITLFEMGRGAGSRSEPDAGIRDLPDRAGGPWRSMADAPTDGTPVLGWDLGSEHVTIAAYLSGAEGWEGWHHSGGLLGPAELSHWMPLPLRPGRWTG